jgi:hypothetical protein
MCSSFPLDQGSEFSNCSPGTRGPLKNDDARQPRGWDGQDHHIGAPLDTGAVAPDPTALGPLDLFPPRPVPNAAGCGGQLIDQHRWPPSTAQNPAIGDRGPPTRSIRTSSPPT